MRRLVLGIAVAVTSLMPVMGVADDQQIADFIKSRLQAEQQQGNLHGFNVDMRVENGTVSFKGYVANTAQEMTILRTAQQAGHLGVIKVVDDIDIKSAQGTTPVTTTAPFQETPLPFSEVAVTAQPIQPSVQPMSQLPTQEVYPQPVQQMVQQSTQPVAPQPIQQVVQQQVQQQIQPFAPQPFQQTMQQPTLQIDPQLMQQMVQQPTMQMVQQPTMQMAQQPTMQMVQQPIAQNNPYQQISAARGAPGVPVNGAPLAFANAGGAPMGPANAPMPYANNGGAQSEAPNLPGYSWPGYAAHPNYAGVSYPQQYSASAWPYIGPFYPYPQVPLGWRKVTLEWDDGWWMLDFNDK